MWMCLRLSLSLSCFELSFVSEICKTIAKNSFLIVIVDRWGTKAARMVLTKRPWISLSRTQSLAER